MITGGSDALIEIDIRDKAFELAKREMGMLRSEDQQKIEEGRKQLTHKNNNVSLGSE
jgi:hypothetical protein